MLVNVDTVILLFKKSCVFLLRDFLILSGNPQILIVQLGKTKHKFSDYLNLLKRNYFFSENGILENSNSYFSWTSIRRGIL